MLSEYRKNENVAQEDAVKNPKKKQRRDKNTKIAQKNKKRLVHVPRKK